MKRRSEYNRLVDNMMKTKAQERQEIQCIAQPTNIFAAIQRQMATAMEGVIKESFQKGLRSINRLSAQTGPVLGLNRISRNSLRTQASVRVVAGMVMTCHLITAGSIRLLRQKFRVV